MLFKNQVASVDLTLHRWQYGMPSTPNTQTCSSSTALLYATDLGPAAAPSTEFFLLVRLLATGLFGDTNIAANDTNPRGIVQMNKDGTNCNIQIASDVLGKCQDDCDVQRV